MFTILLRMDSAILPKLSAGRMSKLNDEQRREIRALLREDKIRAREIANRFGVTAALISRIRTVAGIGASAQPRGRQSALSAAELDEIRSSTAGRKDIAAKFNISLPYVSMIRNADRDRIGLPARHSERAYTAAVRHIEPHPVAASGITLAQLMGGRARCRRMLAA